MAGPTATRATANMGSAAPTGKPLSMQALPANGQRRPPPSPPRNREPPRSRLSSRLGPRHPLIPKSLDPGFSPFSTPPGALDRSPRALLRVDAEPYALRMPTSEPPTQGPTLAPGQARSGCHATAGAADLRRSEVPRRLVSPCSPALLSPVSSLTRHGQARRSRAPPCGRTTVSRRQGAMAKHGASRPDSPQGLNAVRRHAIALRCPGALTVRHARPPAALGNSPLARRD